MSEQEALLLQHVIYKEIGVSIVGLKQLSFGWVCTIGEALIWDLEHWREFKARKPKLVEGGQGVKS